MTKFTALENARIELAARIYERLEDGSLDENRFGRLLRGALAGGALAAPLATPGTPAKAVKPTRPAVERPAVDDSWKDAEYQERRLKAMKDPNDTLMQMSKRYGIPYDDLYKKTYNNQSSRTLDQQIDSYADKGLNKQAVRNVLDRYYRRNQPDPKFRGDTGEGLQRGTQPEDMPQTGETRKARNFYKTATYNYGKSGLAAPHYRGFDLTRGKRGKLLGRPKQT